MIRLKTMRSRRRAFTLVEVLVASAIAALVIGPLIWLLLTAFRVDRASGIEMDLTTDALRTLQRATRDITSSRGVVRFETGGETLDGLQLKTGNLLVYARHLDGTVWRSVYGKADHPVIETERIGVGFKYFHLVPLDRGVHVALELERPALNDTAIAGEASARRLELSTVVVPRGW